jgi:hypothetical protein
MRPDTCQVLVPRGWVWHRCICSAITPNCGRRIGNRRRAGPCNPSTPRVGVQKGLAMRYCVACCLSLFLAFAMPALAESPQAALKALGLDQVAFVESAQPEHGVLVERAGQPAHFLSLDRIAALARTTQRVGFTTGRGEQQNEWAGPLLWDVLDASGLIEGANPREQAHLAVRVTGADGYSAVIALGEISPQFAERPILLADQLNGGPLPEHALRLIVPGDRLGGRSVRDVVRIAIE